MPADLTSEYLFVGGEPILSLAEFQSYAYGLPEGEEAPQLMSRWLAGEDVKARDLVHCLRHEAIAVAASSDESLEIVRLALERLQVAFPAESAS